MGLAGLVGDSVFWIRVSAGIALAAFDFPRQADDMLGKAAFSRHGTGDFECYADRFNSAIELAYGRAVVREAGKCLNALDAAERGDDGHFDRAVPAYHLQKVVELAADVAARRCDVDYSAYAGIIARLTARVYHSNGWTCNG